MPNKGSHIMNGGGIRSGDGIQRKDHWSDRLVGWIVFTIIFLVALPYALALVEWVVCMICGKSFGIAERLWQ
jgi:hypothetical protein